MWAEMPMLRILSLGKIPEEHVRQLSMRTCGDEKRSRVDVQSLFTYCEMKAEQLEAETSCYLFKSDASWGQKVSFGQTQTRL